MRGDELKRSRGREQITWEGDKGVGGGASGGGEEGEEGREGRTKEEWE